MTIDDLCDALTHAVSTGRIGTPMAVRINVQLADAAADLAAWSAAIETVVNAVFPLRPARIRAVGNAPGNQRSLVFRTANGQTGLITVGRGSTASSTLDLLVVGNRGVLRLEGSELFDATLPDSAVEASAVELWSRVFANGAIDAGYLELC